MEGTDEKRWGVAVGGTGMGAATEGTEVPLLPEEGVETIGTDDGGDPAAKGALDGPDEMKEDLRKGRGHGGNLLSGDEVASRDILCPPLQRGEASVPAQDPPPRRIALPTRAKPAAASRFYGERCRLCSLRKR